MGKRGLKIIVVGAGKVGDTLVNRLAEEGHDLVIIDKNVDRLTELANLCDCMGVIGNGASHEVLEERLIKRHTDSMEDIKHRIELAKTELSLADVYKYNVVNDDLKKAVDKIEEILEKELLAHNR